MANRVMSRQDCDAEFKFESRVDYLVFMRLCYDLHIRRLPSMEVERDGRKLTRSWVSAPEFKIWYLMDCLDNCGSDYETDWGRFTG